MFKLLLIFLIIYLIFRYLFKIVLLFAPNKKQNTENNHKDFYNPNISRKNKYKQTEEEFVDYEEVK